MLHFILFLCCWFYLVFFFFKQKTAYEMRISDWSSDVCSSDLFPLDQDGGLGRFAEGLKTGAGEEIERPQRRGRPRLLEGDRPGGDRKSVVKGKSVSVRVDLGGRRIMKKKLGLKK